MRWSDLKIPRTLLFLLISALVPLQATLAATLSGRVLGGNEPLADTRITISVTGDTDPVAEVITNAQGQYMAELDPGLYDLVVAPPVETGYGVTLVSAVNLTEAGLVRDIVLLDAGNELSGVVRGPGGMPLAGIWLMIRKEGTETQITAPGALETDAQGRYRILLADGTYSISAYHYPREGGNPDLVQLQVEPVIGSLPLTASRQLDIQLPLSLVSGRVTDPQGQGVAGARIEVSWSWNDPERWGVFSTFGAVFSDANGDYRFIVTQGVDALTVVPPTDSGLGLEYVSGLDTQQDLALDLPLVEARVLSGTVRGAGDAPVPHAAVVLQDSATGDAVIPWETFVSDADGRYAIPLGTGTYDVSVSFGPRAMPELGMSQLYFEFFPVLENIALGESTARDLVLPLAIIRGTVRDPGGAVVAGAEVRSTRDVYAPDGRSWQRVDSRAVTDAAGRYTVYALLGTGRLMLLPPEGSTLGITIGPEIEITGDMELDLAFGAAYLVSGTVRGYGGVPVSDIQFVIRDVVTEVLFAAPGELMTDAQGRYEVRLPAGQYSVQLIHEPEISANPELGLIDIGPPFEDGLTVSGDTVRDVQLPLIRISGRTLDENGVPVSGVVLKTREDGWEDTSLGFVQYRRNVVTTVSDAAGHYEMLVLSGTESQLISPPAGSGFADTLVSGMELRQDTTQDIILPYIDLRAPRLVSGPRIALLESDSVIVEWGTDKPAATRLSLSGTSYGEDGYRLQHSVTLPGLLADTAYRLDITPVDVRGNVGEPRTLSFRTPLEGASAGLLVIEGPSISHLTPESVLVEWRTSVGTDTVVEYGLDEQFNMRAQLDGMRAEHSLSLANLDPGAMYSLRVVANDGSGGSPAVSHTVRFRLRDLPDEQPPLIISGPIVTDVTHDSLTIEWETNEPADSSLSVNDGTNYIVLSDANLKQRHLLHVPGLLPETTYEFTISATDASGNGPTLSEPRMVATLPAPEPVFPELVGFVAVAGITDTGAIFQWRTDRPADSLVGYSANASSLDRFIASADLTSEHQMVLTGLEPGTTYWFLVQSNTPDGLSVSSAVSSFSTLAEPAEGGPVFVEAPTIVGVTDTSVTMAWVTDVPVSSVVVYGTGNSEDFRYDDGVKKTEHTVTLTELEPGAVYSFTVIITDIDGNSSSYTSSGDPSGQLWRPEESPLWQAFGLDQAVAQAATTAGFITATEPDVTAPLLLEGPAFSDLEAGVVGVTFATNEPVVVEMAYGPNAAAARKRRGVLRAGLEHDLVLAGVQAGVLQAYSMRLTDVAGNTTTRTGWFTPGGNVTPDEYVVSANAGSGGAVEPASRRVAPGGTATFLVTPALGFEQVDQVLGSCPAGRWSGSSYVTGEIRADCSLSFQFVPTTSNPGTGDPVVFEGPAGRTVTCTGLECQRAAADANRIEALGIGFTDAAGAQRRADIVATMYPAESGLAVAQSHALEIRDSAGRLLLASSVTVALPKAATEVFLDTSDRPVAVTTAEAADSTRYRIETQGSGVLLAQVEPAGSTRITNVRSALAGGNVDVSVAGEMRVVVPLDSSGQARSVILVSASGSLRSRYEEFASGAWQVREETVDPADAFPAGSSLVLERVNGRVRVRVEATIQDDLVF